MKLCVFEVRFELSFFRPKHHLRNCHNREYSHKTRCPLPIPILGEIQSHTAEKLSPKFHNPEVVWAGATSETMVFGMNASCRPETVARLRAGGAAPPGDKNGNQQPATSHSSLISREKVLLKGGDRLAGLLTAFLAVVEC